MTIAIIGAMEKEIKIFIDMYHLELLEENIYRGSFNDTDIILARSGIGKVNAAITAQYLIDKYKPNYIINSGCAGSLTENVKIMDIVVAEHATYHDFSPIRIMEESTPDNGKIKTDEKLFNLTVESLKELQYQYVIGSIASGDMFVTSDKMRDDIYNRTLSLAVDMESASIAHACKKNNIPFMSIRTISDFADGVEEREEEAANKSAEVVNLVVKKINNF